MNSSYIKFLKAGNFLLLKNFLFLLCSPVQPVFALSDIPAEFQKCSTSSECELYLDGCHSCGDFIAVRKGYQDKLREFDYKQRTAENNLKDCEACDMRIFGVQAVCKDERCVVNSSDIK